MGDAGAAATDVTVLGASGEIGVLEQAARRAAAATTAAVEKV